MNFFEVIQIFSSNVWIYGGTFLLILGILVFIHEWGHYIVARLCGVHVEAFSIGFGKELFAFNDKNGTRWKIALIPLGGYVKLFGDIDPDGLSEEEQKKTKKLTKAEKKTAFYAKPLWQRAAVVVAGPAINYIFAIILLTGLFVFNGKPVTPPVAAAIVGDSSANEHGFLPHDRLVSIDGKAMRSFEDLHKEMMIALDDEKHFVVQRGDEMVDIYAKPRKIESKDRFGFSHSRGLLGLISPRHAIDIKNVIKVGDKSFEKGEDIERVRAEITSRLDDVFSIQVSIGEITDDLVIQPLAEFNETLNSELVEGEDNPKRDLLFLSDTSGNAFLKYPPPEAFVKAVRESWIVTRGTLEALGQMVVGTRSASELGGVIRIGALAGDMAKQGIVSIILFMALLSINLGLINLFPIPMLDGGHLMFYALEGVMGRPVSERFQEYAFRAGLVFLVGIMVFANLNDVIQLLL